MIEKLQEVENRFEEVNELVCNPDIVCDQEKYTKLMRELKHLTPVVEKFREYKKAKASEEESRAMLDEGGMGADFARSIRQSMRLLLMNLLMPRVQLFTILTSMRAVCRLKNLLKEGLTLLVSAL